MNRSRILLSLLAGATAFWLALAVTEPLGPGLDPDAMAYTYAAGTLAHGGVLRDVRDDWVSADSTRPLTRWPPGFSAAIALPVAAGASPVQGARLVMAAAAFAALATLVWVVSGAAGFGAGVVLAVALLVTPAMAIVHESVLSEPLFLAALAVTLALMARARPAPLLEGMAAAAASLVRYAGLSAIGAVCAWELLREGAMRDRVRRSALAALPGILANAWWWGRAAHAGGRAAVRHFSLYGQIGPTLAEGGGTLIAWAGPGLWRPWDVIVPVAIALALMLWHGNRPLASGAGRAPSAERRRVLVASGLLILAYWALVLAARVLADPDIPLDERIMSPALLLLTVWVVTITASTWQEAPRAWRAAAGIAGAAWCAGSLAVTRGTVRYALETGNDYADICWTGSPVTAWVRAHGDGHALVSNANVAIYFHTGRLARVMPDEMRADSFKVFTDTLAARRAYVVLYDQSCAVTIEQPDSLVQALGLVPVVRLRTGSIWQTR